MRIAIIDRGGADRFARANGDAWLHQFGTDAVLLTPLDKVSKSRLSDWSAVLGFPINSEPTLIGMLTALHAGQSLDAVVVFPENLQLPVAQFRTEHGLSGPHTGWVAPFRDKDLMKQVARAGGLRCAPHAPVDTPADVAPFFAQYGKVVVKPRAGAGSVGVHVLTSTADLDLLPPQLRYHQVEQFVEGEMLHVDCLVRDGSVLHRTVFRYVGSQLDHTTGRPTGTATSDDLALQRAADALTSQVLEAFSVRDAVLHLEAFISPDGLVFNEVACRVGGGTINEMVYQLSGYNLMGSMIDMAVGEPSKPDPDWQPGPPAIGDVMFYARPGVFEGMDDAMVPPDWLISRQVFADVGDSVQPLGRVGGSIAQYVVAGSDEEQVRARIDWICEKVTVRVEQPRR